MIKTEIFIEKVKELQIDTLIGVPDSTLKEFCDYIHNKGQENFDHYVPANEGAAVGMAAGVFLATGRPALLYMQNSGLGNTVNPITSLMNKEVYDIPALLVIGWRGEPGVYDEPQHQFMGAITEQLLDLLEISHRILDENTQDEDLDNIFMEAGVALKQKRQFAILVKKNAFRKENFEPNKNNYTLIREDIIGKILKQIGPEDMVVSTTGKISRELYEQSDRLLGQHQQEFLTVGGMGHASMIAFGVAVSRKDRRVYCIDGDGAALMHMGNLAFIGKAAPKNLIHICLNNEAHESVGGMPTGAVGQEFAKIAQASGYKKAEVIENSIQLDHVLKEMWQWEGPAFLEIKVALGSRKDLGRPREKAVENKENFMKYHGVTE